MTRQKAEGDEKRKEVKVGESPQLRAHRVHVCVRDRAQDDELRRSESAAPARCRAAYRCRDMRSASRALAARGRTTIRPSSCCSPGSRRGGQRPDAAAPATRQAEQAPRRTVEAKCSCATDASPRSHRSPSRAGTEDDLRVERVERGGEQPVDHRLGARARRSGRAPPRGRVCAAGGDTAAGSPMLSLTGGADERRRLGRGEAVVEVPPHPPDAVEVVQRVEPQPAAERVGRSRP